MKGIKSFSVIAVLVLTLIAMTGIATAVPVSVDEVKINGDEVSSGETLYVERGDALEIKTKMTATGDASNVELRAFIAGYEYSDHEKTSDSAHIFDLENGLTYKKTFTIDLPTKLDKDNYKLRFYVVDRNGESTEKEFNLKVGSQRHALNIKDVVFSPEGTVKAGRALLSTVRIKNIGEKDEDGIKVKMSIPELGIRASEYIDEIEADETKTSEELLMRIPKSVKAGEYTAIASVEFDEGYETSTKEFTIKVESDAAAQEASTSSQQIILSVAETPQDIAKGKGGAIYPLTISNTGSTSKTFTINAEAGEWASVRISPSNHLVVGPNQAEAAYIYVSASEEAQAGEQVFSLSVKSGENTLKTISLKANVVESAKAGSWDKVKKGLEIGLVVLVVLLVILGLIIGFNRLKADDEDEDLEAGQTYY